MAQVLVNLPLVERRKRLESEFVPVDGGFQMATSQLAATAEELSAHFDSSLQQAHIEGLVVKLWTEATATYELGKRSLKWLKVLTLRLLVVHVLWCVVELSSVTRALTFS